MSGEARRAGDAAGCLSRTAEPKACTGGFLALARATVPRPQRRPAAMSAARTLPMPSARALNVINLRLPMPTLRELPLWLRASLKLYPWRRLDPVPCARLSGPISKSRVALVTTAGLVVPGQPAFDESIKGGDVSFRVIPGDARVQSLEEHHRSKSFDHSGIARDRNLALPLDRLRELAALGAIGELAPRHLSFMGSITAPGVREGRPCLPWLTHS